MSGRGNTPLSSAIFMSLIAAELVSSLASKDHESKEAMFRFNMFGKHRGRLLDTMGMTAVTIDPPPIEQNSSDQNELRRVELRFQNLKQRQVFEGLFEELSSSVSEDPPRFMNRTSLITGSLIPGTPMGR